MDELYLLSKQVKELYSKIPLNERDNNIASPQKQEYQKALQSFIKIGKNVFGDDLDLEELNERIKWHSILSVKAVLAKEPQDIYALIPEMDNVTSDAFMRLEYSLSSRKENLAYFYHDAIFSDNRDFLTNFNEEDIASFERFQEFIKNTSENTNINKL